MAERSNAAVLPTGSFGKTVEVQASGGSNPSLSAITVLKVHISGAFAVLRGICVEFI